VSSQRSGGSSLTTTPEFDQSAEQKKVGWVFLVSKPDAASFTLTARSGGIVQSSFNSAWRITGFCGSGGCADVYTGKGQGDIQCAVKVLKQPLSSQSPEEAEKSWVKLMNELGAMRALQQSSYVPQLFGSFLIRTVDGTSTALNLSVVQEYYPVSLTSMRSNGPFSELESRPIMTDLLRALKFIHSRSHAHRDVKMCNVMMKSQAGPAVLIDYGFTSVVGENSSIKTIAGTPGYLAPELFRRAGWDRRPSDIYSFACVAHNLVSKVPVFHGKNAAEVLELNRYGMAVLVNLPLEFTH
jgi:serine/threonine protein kinase